MKGGLTIFICFLFFSIGVSQNFETILEKDNLLIGEQIMLTYHYRLQENDSLTCENWKNSIPLNPYPPKSKSPSKEKNMLEIRRSFSDTILKINGKREWFGTYLVTAWDSGSFSVPPQPFKINGKRLEFPSTVLKVNLVPTVKGQGIYDIEESFVDIPEESLREKIERFHAKNWLWLYSILAAFIGLFIYRKWKSRRKNKTKFSEFTLKEKTIMAIEELDRREGWRKNKLKEHYVELSFILRSYLGIRFELNLLEKTSYEAKLLLAQIGLPANTLELIEEVLNQADMVKFAKSSPDDLTVTSISRLAKKIVIETSTVKDVI
jgi:hypothetical protein